MSARPGIIKQVLDIPLTAEQRARDDVVATQEFVQSRQTLWKLLKEEVIKVQEAQIRFQSQSPAQSPARVSGNGLINAVRVLTKI